MNTIDNENITDSSSRLPFIYGMKGIAALSVFLCHIIAVFLPGFRFYNNENITTIEKVWLETPLNAFTNGNTPVQFFFVISGFLIARNKNKLGGVISIKKDSEANPNCLGINSVFVFANEIRLNAQCRGCKDE